MTTLDVQGGRLYLADVPLRLNTVVQQVMGARHVRNSDDWTTPLTWTALHQVVNELKPTGDLELTQAVRDWSGEEFTRVQELFALQNAQDYSGNSQLIPLQRVGTHFLLRGERTVLADDMGAGKTVMTCDALTSTTASSILIACPKTIMPVWRNHLNEWTKDITPIVASDSSVKRRKAIDEAIKLYKAGRRVALIINYESVWRHTKLSPYGNLRLEKCEKCDPLSLAPVTKAKCETCRKELNEIPWEVVICDEAHRVINVTKQTRGIWQLSQDANYVWALTGTPSRGSVADFWSLLRLVDPVAWPSRSKFIDRYCLAASDNWGNLVVRGLRPDREAEWKQVTGQYMLRRSYEEIKKQWAELKGEDYVPTEVRPMQRFVDLTVAQRTLYNELVDKIFVTLPNGKIVFSDNSLEELTRLLQVSAASIDVDDDGAVHMVMPSPKVNELVEIVKDAGDEPVVVFAVNRDLVDLSAAALEKVGITTAKVHGGIDKDEREREILRFQDGAARVILLTFAAGSEGITLTRASMTVYLQRSWSMILNKQADGRTNRFGQSSNTITYLDVIASDTVEQRVLEAYGDKLDQLEAVVNDAERMKKLVTG